jgi:tRNA threonylcarbamoyladenosine biosynthesis protein TsaB
LTFDPDRPVLIIDTSSERCLVAVARDQAIVTAIEWLSGRNQSRDLAPAIEDALSRAEIRRQDLSGVIVTVGPGSYAGVRVGVSCARALAFALGVPCVGVERLAADARGPLLLGLPDVYVAMEAGRGHFGLARYRLADVLPAELQAPQSATAEELAAARPRVGQGPGATPWSRRPDDLLAIGLAYLLQPEAHPANPIYLREPAITRPSRAPF